MKRKLADVIAEQLSPVSVQVAGIRKPLQEELHPFGTVRGEADGVFGKKTDIAVRNFQSDKGLIVDGIVGKYTAESLGFDWEG